MIYILLIIIAIGVLQLSTEGKEFLNSLWIIGLIAGGLYLAFWIVVIVMGLLSDKVIRENVFTIIGAIMLSAYAIYGIYTVYKKHQRGELTKQIIKSKAKDLWLKNWKQNPKIIIFLILAFSFLLYMLIYSLTIKDFWQQ